MGIARQAPAVDGAWPGPNCATSHPQGPPGFQRALNGFPAAIAEKHRQSELSDFGDESRQFARLFAEPAPTNERAPLDSTGGIAVDVKTEGGLLYGMRLPAVKWFLLSILSLKPS